MKPKNKKRFCRGSIVLLSLIVGISGIFVRNVSYEMWEYLPQAVVLRQIQSLIGIIFICFGLLLGVIWAALGYIEAVLEENRIPSAEKKNRGED